MFEDLYEICFCTKYGLASSKPKGVSGYAGAKVAAKYLRKSGSLLKSVARSMLPFADLRNQIEGWDAAPCPVSTIRSLYSHDIKY
jgi:hypothetical protein